MRREELNVLLPRGPKFPLADRSVLERAVNSEKHLEIAKVSVQHAR